MSRFDRLLSEALWDSDPDIKVGDYVTIGQGDRVGSNGSVNAVRYMGMVPPGRYRVTMVRQMDERQLPNIIIEPPEQFGVNSRDKHYGKFYAVYKRDIIGKVSKAGPEQPQQGPADQSEQTTEGMDGVNLPEDQDESGGEGYCDVCPNRSRCDGTNRCAHDDDQRRRDREENGREGGWEVDEANLPEGSDPIEKSIIAALAEHDTVNWFKGPVTEKTINVVEALNDYFGETFVIDPNGDELLPTNPIGGELKEYDDEDEMIADIIRWANNWPSDDETYEYDPRENGTY